MPRGRHELGDEVGDGGQPLGPDPVVPLAAEVVGDDQARLREHPQVLAHGRPADLAARREVDDPGAATGQGAQQVAAHRVRDRAEDVHGR